MLAAVKKRLKMQSSFSIEQWKTSPVMIPTEKTKSPWVAPLSLSSNADFSSRPTPSYGRRSTFSLISHLNSVFQIKPISWTSSRTQSNRSPNSQPQYLQIQLEQQTKLQFAPLRASLLEACVQQCIWVTQSTFFLTYLFIQTIKTTKDCFHSYQ